MHFGFGAENVGVRAAVEQVYVARILYDDPRNVLARLLVFELTFKSIVETETSSIVGLVIRATLDIE